MIARCVILLLALLMVAGCGLVPIPVARTLPGDIRHVQVFHEGTEQPISNAEVVMQAKRFESWSRSFPPVYTANFTPAGETNIVIPLQQIATGRFMPERTRVWRKIRPWGIGPLGTALHEDYALIISAQAEGYTPVTATYSPKGKLNPKEPQNDVSLPVPQFQTNGMLALYLRLSDSKPNTAASASHLAVVRTWGDLNAQTRIAAGYGLYVRLGISADHAPLNSGALIYCLADGYDYFENPNITANSLGPLSVSVRRGDELLVGSDTNQLLLTFKGWNTTRGCTLFFARPVLMDKPGTYEITISTQNGRELAQAAIATDKSFYHPWTPFLLEKESQWERVPRSDAYRQTHPAVLSVPGIGIAVTKWEGHQLEVFSGHANIGYDISGKEFEPKPATESLPLLVPEQPDPNLKLSIQNGLVSITAKTDTETSRPDHKLLARWWVNGKPFVPKRGDAPSFGGGDTIHVDKRIRFQLNLDAAKIGARTGDQVEVQMLLCESWGYVENPERTMSRNGNARLTNKVSFTAR